MVFLDFPALVKPESIISIPLSQGKRAHFNARHWELIRPHNWCATKERRTFYASTHIRRTDGTRTTLKMHRLLLGLTDPKMRVDHIDHDGLNNLDNNIRVATNRQNCSNLRDKPSMSSQYTGVCWDTSTQKWRARIRVGDGTQFLGNFYAEKDARDAYLAALAELGETPL